MQGYNRYSYGANNPLSGTDPSGYGFKDVFNAIFDIVKIVVAITVGVMGGQWELAAAIIGSLSFMQTLANGGTFGDALIAGVSSAAMTYFGGEFFPGVGEFDLVYTLGIGALGGITSALQGGKFGHGFISAGIGAASGSLKFSGPATSQVVKRTLTAVVVGGTATRISGGKFANGAGTAMFSSLIASAASVVANNHRPVVNSTLR